MAKLVLFEASPWRVSDGGVDLIRLAGGGVKPYTGLRGFTDWRSGVVEFPTFTASAGFSETGWSGGALPQNAAVRFMPSDDTLRNNLLANYLWVGALVEIRSGDDVLAPGTYVLEMSGTIASVSVEDGVITFTVADNSVKLSVPVVTALFAGTGGIEGPAEAEGKPKRRSFGFVRNVEGNLLDKPNNIFEFGDPAFALNQFSSVFDMGRAAAPAPTVLAWQGSIAATFAALQASSPVAGSAVVAPSIACVKWWTQPVGPLTADMQGDLGVGYINKIADIASRLAAIASVTVASADVTTINGVRVSTAGLHIGDNNETFANALDRLLIPANVLWGLNPDGTIRLGEIQVSTSSATITAIQVDRAETLKPCRKVSLGYRRNHRIHSAGEISAAILVSDLPDLSAPVGVLVPNYVAPGDNNRVRFSKLEKELVGWNGFVRSGAPTISSFAAFHNDDDFLWMQGSFTAASQQVTIANNADVWGGGSKGFRIPVTPGERVFVQALFNVSVMPAAGRFYLWNEYFTDANSVISSGAVGGIVRTTVSAGWELIGGFVTIPAGAVSLSFEPICDNLGSGTATGAFSFAIKKMMVSSAAAAQTAFPAFSPGPTGEAGAEITKTVDGPPQSTVFRYDYTGVAESGEFNRDLSFKLNTASGQVTSGITWTYTVKAGTVNGFTSASGPQSMSGSGTGTLTVSSLGTSTASVEVKATLGGFPYIKTFDLAQQVAAPPVSGGGGGSQTLVTKTSGFTGPTTTTFVDSTGAMNGTTPAGVTAVNVNVNINASPVGSSTGSWTVEAKLMRDVGGVPTQVGSTQSAGSSYIAAGGGEPADVSPAHLAFAIPDTGLTAGVAYTWRIYTRITSGTRGHTVTGTVSVTT